MGAACCGGPEGAVGDMRQRRNMKPQSLNYLKDESQEPWKAMKVKESQLIALH